MNKKDKQFFIFLTILILVIIIFYVIYIGNLNANIKTVKNEIKRNEIKYNHLKNKILKLKKEIEKWENTENDLTKLKKEYLFSIKEQNILRFNIEQILIDSGINPANEKTSLTKLSKGFYTLNIKFSTIPQENMLLLIENIKTVKQLIFIDSLNIKNSPQIFSSVVIKGVLIDEK